MGCQHYLSDIRTDPGCDQIIDIINYIVIPHKVLPLQDLRVLVLQKGIGLDGPVPSLRVWGRVMHQAAVTRSFSWTERPQ